MQIQSLPKVKSKIQKRVGRGAGSGKGKTAGRGQKGQKARGTVKVLYEGGQLSLIKRLPFLRGKGRNKPHSNKPFPINLKYLNLLPENTVVDMNSLLKYKLIRKDFSYNKVKILGDGELSKVLTVNLPCSKGAQKKILKAGGKVEGK